MTDKVLDSYFPKLFGSVRVAGALSAPVSHSCTIIDQWFLRSHTRVGYKVMATVRYFWHGFIHIMYLQYSRPLIYHFLPNVWKASYTISASMFRINRPIARISSSCVLYLVPRNGSFTFTEEISQPDFDALRCVHWNFILLEQHCFFGITIPGDWEECILQNT